jgi:hypothetical protein
MLNPAQGADCALAVAPYKVRKPSNADKKQFRMKFMGVDYLVKKCSIIYLLFFSTS